MESSVHITAAVVRELGPSLVAYARRSARRPEDAEDLVQDMWLSALRSTSPFEGRSRLRTWLIGILRHRMADHFRRTKSMDELDESNIAGVDVSVLDQLEVAQAASQAMDALEDLTELERTVVRLYGLQDLDRDEVCERLGITRVHLRVLLYRARRKLEENAQLI